ncbi:histone-lysine N-methyltransferase SETMAR [Trichonephila clavata]|uniref:Histone-lysine N-methyltransferase SETMAR n=1 Tax=Trichonephila clavata TaxID=2740835 RepID=A0A8X6G8Q9_TRICU|nr:histone-lysine N-methyltransferase SETMAR [Trichonephila clavata]
MHDIPRYGRPHTATTDENVRRGGGDRITANRRITIDKVAEELEIGHERAHKISNDILRYRKVSARWALRHTWNNACRSTWNISCVTMKMAMALCFGLKRGMNRGSTISRPKRRPHLWKYPSSPVRKKFKTTPSAGKVLLTIF